MARLMSLVDEGFAVRRQTQEALYCMQMMTRIQTQLYTRRLKTEKDKKVLKSQTKAVNKHSLDKAKVRCTRSFMHGLMQSFKLMHCLIWIADDAHAYEQYNPAILWYLDLKFCWQIGEGWDHSLQSKEQMETVQKMKQEAATRRQRALSYAFSQQVNLSLFSS